MLGLIHKSHFGIEKSISHTCELLYWPKMIADIEHTTANCKLGSKYRNSQQREPMISHDILTLSLPRSLIDDLVFSVFPSNFVKLSYKISLLKNRFVTLFFIRFS